MRRPLILAGTTALLLLAGCHSAYIEATLHNGTSAPLTLVELDYPSAGFGTQTLLPNQDFHYRFKVLGEGDLKLLYTDPARIDHKVTGPHLHEGDEGTLLIAIAPTAVQWTPTLTHH